MSLFPGLRFGAGYKVLQRVYKFGGQVSKPPVCVSHAQTDQTVSAIRDSTATAAWLHIASFAHFAHSNFWQDARSEKHIIRSSSGHRGCLQSKYVPESLLELSLKHSRCAQEVSQYFRTQKWFKTWRKYLLHTNDLLCFNGLRHSGARREPFFFY